MFKKISKYGIVLALLIVPLFCLTYFVYLTWFPEKYNAPPIALFPHATEYQKTITYPAQKSYEWYTVTFSTDESPENVYFFYSKEMPIYHWVENEPGNRALLFQYGQTFYQSDPDFSSGGHFIVIHATKMYANTTRVTVEYSYMNS